jgi:hypothetical protein
MSRFEDLMPEPLPESHLDRAFYRLGYLLEELSLHGDGKASAAGPAEELRRVFVASALTAVLRPRKVGWSRLVAATLVGNLLGEALTGFGMDRLTDEELDARLQAELDAEEAALSGHDEAVEGDFADIYAAHGGAEAYGFDAELAAEEMGEDFLDEEGAAGAFGAGLGGREAPGTRWAVGAEDEREERALEHAAADAGRALAQRAADDLVTAAVYASLIYPRIPGPSLLKGLAFGLLDAGTGTGGGAVGVLRGLAPQVRYPLARLHPGGGERGGIRALSLGLALGLLYRPPAENDGEK